MVDKVGDQEAQGQEIAIVRGRKACPVAAMKSWLEAAGITEGPVLRRMRRGGVVLDDALRPQGIAQVVKLYAEKAGYDSADFSGHSLRSGFLTSAAARGASVFKLIEVSRHKSVDTLRGYIRRVEMFEDHGMDQFEGGFSEDYVLEPGETLLVPVSLRDL